MLYLDTARVGRMSPGAEQAQIDFTRMARAEGSSARFDHFLRYGTKPTGWHYPGLLEWQGVANLKQSLRQLAGSSPELPVLVANRSAQLMKLAARLMYHTCWNVLVTDIGWSPYHDVLEKEARLTNGRVTIVAVRDAILQGKMTSDELAEHLRNEYRRNGCDGLFLSGVSNLGPQLPVKQIVRAIEAVCEIRFVVIDGAQQFCHISSDIRNEYCDFFLAGCHKWLGAYHPMGLGFYGRRRSQSLIETILAWLICQGEIDDPLLRFSSDLEMDAVTAMTETVNLTSLFSCQGAVSDALCAASSPNQQFTQRLLNLSAITPMAAVAGWQPLVPCADFRTGILLLQSERTGIRVANPEVVRSAFCDHGVALTAYPEGMIRLSMPERPWNQQEIDQLHLAFQATRDACS